MSVLIFEIPLTPGVPQTVTVTMSQVDYQFTFNYRDVIEGGWVMDIATAAGTPIVAGIPLVTGANLLAQYYHLGFVGSIYVQTVDDPNAVPTFDSLGDRGKVFYLADA